MSTFNKVVVLCFGVVGCVVVVLDTARTNRHLRRLGMVPVYANAVLAVTAIVLICLLTLAEGDPC